MKSSNPLPFLLLLFSFSTLSAITAIAQVSKIDNLTRLLANEKTDSNKVTLLWQLAEQYQVYKPDTSLQLAQKALLLAQRIRFTEGESRSLAILATSQYLLGDYPSALKNYLLKLKIEEKRNNPRNYASALNNIGITYILMEEYPSALDYLYRAHATADAAGKEVNEELKYSIEINLGEAYYRMKKPDSAALYFNRALTLAKLSDDNIETGVAILGMANVFAFENQYEVALHTYRAAYSYLNAGSDADILCEVSLGMAKAFERLSEKDSAAFYGSRSFGLAAGSKLLSRQLDAALFLSGLNNKAGRYDSAFSYLQLSAQLQDSIKGNEKTKAVMILSLNEGLRQQEIAEQKLRDKKDRIKRLQWSIIAICIPFLFLITLLVSRVRVNRKLVSFMGIISLLFLFEFLTLLLHPIVANFTNHIPIFELLVFVGIAALLIPAHHKLEHLLIKKLTRGNQNSSNIQLQTKKIVLKNK